MKKSHPQSLSIHSTNWDQSRLIGLIGDNMVLEVQSARAGDADRAWGAISAGTCVPQARTRFN
jgi:hypothetical protein